MINKTTQQGVGLVEVMIALAIILVTAMAMGQLQTSSLVGTQASSLHFSLNRLGSEMLETLRAHPVDAADGEFNLDHTQRTPETLPPVVRTWSNLVMSTIPTGQGGIDCDAVQCEVTISWVEETDGTDVRKLFRIRTPL